MYREKEIFRFIRLRVAWTVSPFFLVYVPNHLVYRPRWGSVLVSLSSVLALGRSFWTSTAAASMLLCCSSEQFLNFGFFFDRGFHLTRLSWTCREATRLPESLTLAMPSTVA